MRYLKTLLLLALLPLCAAAQTWDDAMYKQIEANVVEPVFAAKTFDIVKYGASLKATAAKNQIAINKAIDACSKAGGGTVVIPEGIWNTGAITLKDNVNLQVSKGATLLFAFDPQQRAIVPTRWEGNDCLNYQPCIYAYQAKNIAVTGEGTIDGNGSNDTWWKMSNKKGHGLGEDVGESQKVGSPELRAMGEAKVPMAERNMKGKGLRPQLINFYQCENILIEGVTMLRSPFWVMHPLLSKNITVRGVTVWNEGPNGDGFDPESCENIILDNVTFHTGDDCIAIKSGRNNDGRLWNLPTKNMIIRNCNMADGHGGVSIGSEISGGANNIFVENCVMDSPNLDVILRIKTSNCRGGIIENVYMRNVKVGQCAQGVLLCSMLYDPKEVGQRGFNPTIRNIYMSNVTSEKSDYGVCFEGLDDVDNIYNINVIDCRFNGVTGKPIMVTGKVHDIHFDNLYINGSLTLAQRPYKNYSEWLTASEMARTPQSYLLDFSKKPKWSYVMGIELEAMLDTYLAYKNDDVLKYVAEYPAKMIDAKGNITGYKYDDFNLDNVRTGKFIFNYNKLYPAKNVDKAIKTLFKQLENQPRTDDGVWWHKAIYANQVWLDGVFMGMPFYVNAAPVLKGEKKATKYYDDAVKQMLTTDARTYDAKTGLWKHAWDSKHSIFWADSQTGQSQHTWARALGWYAMALLEVLEALPQDYAQRAEVAALYNKVMTAVVKYQDKKTGLWYDVMDVNDSRNYLEATCSSMFSYCLLKGYRLGYLDKSFCDAGVKAYNGILNKFIRVNSDKTMSLTTCCEVSGLGPDNNTKRDGSFDYYMSEPIRDNDAKGVGPFIWASLEMEQQGLATDTDFK